MTYPVSIRGQVFASCKDAADHFGRSPSTVRSLIARGRQDYLATPPGPKGSIPHNRKRLKVGPHEWPSIAAAAEALGYRSLSHFRRILKQGHHERIIARAMKLGGKK